MFLVANNAKEKQSMIEEYLHRDTGDLVEAAQWQGHIHIFQTWMGRYGGVPISLTPLPELTLLNCQGNAAASKPTQILIKIDDLGAPTSSDPHVFHSSAG
jgi:hypothetical protein